MRVEQFTKDEWALLSEAAHLTVFGKDKPAHFDRIDYAILCVDEAGLPMGYLTAYECREGWTYWQFGGAFPGTRGTSKTFQGYLAMIELERKRGVTRITTLIENDNLVYLKMATKVGFRITGVRYHEGSVLLEHNLLLHGGG